MYSGVALPRVPRCSFGTSFFMGKEVQVLYVTADGDGGDKDLERIHRHTESKV